MYYYSGTDGGEFTDAEIHTTGDCPRLRDADGHTRPLAESSVETIEDPTHCPECGTAETCDVVKSDGEVCGRELPCPYHSED